MHVRVVLSSVAILCCAQTLVVADGMVYRLPEDGVWARFSMEGVVLDSETQDNAPDVNITGTLTISSVGSVLLEGERCRWIEIVIDARRDGKEFQEVDKLLIPEQYLTRGKQPLEHVRDAWCMHSMIDNGKPRRIEDVRKLDIVNVQTMRLVLHPPFLDETPAGRTTLACKLGSVECERIEATEKEKHAGSDIEHNSSYTVSLHDSAPFGVVAWQGVSRVWRGEECLGAMKLKMTLVDFGKDAASLLSMAE